MLQQRDKKREKKERKEEKLSTRLKKKRLSQIRIVGVTWKIRFCEEEQYIEGKDRNKGKIWKYIHVQKEV